MPEQQLPIPNDHPHIVDLVIEDLHARRRVGIERYGTALQAFNGRSALRDLYEELLDAVQYARQVIEENPGIDRDRGGLCYNEEQRRELLSFVQLAAERADAAGSSEIREFFKEAERLAKKYGGLPFG